MTLVSLKDGLDLATPTGRLVARIMASVAAYDVEVLTEKQLAGIEAAKQEMEDGTLGVGLGRPDRPKFNPGPAGK